MNMKKLIGILSGCLLTTIVGIVCISQYVVNKSMLIEESEVLDQSNSIQSIYTTKRVSVNPATKGTYTKLDFSNVEEFLTSLNDTINIEYIDTLYEERVYDSKSEDIISLYKNSNSSVTVAVLPDSSISYCMFEGLSEEDTNKIIDLSKDSEYNYKVVPTGFLLEPEIIVS